MKYSDLNLTINKDYIVIEVKGKEIHVLKYLPIQDKIDLIDIALQRAWDNGFYNQTKLAMYFNLYLIYMYTDLEFTDEEKANQSQLYNELESNGVIIAVIGALQEYNDIFELLNISKQAKVDYFHSAAALLQTFIQDMPKNAQAMSQIVDNFDKEKYKEVVDFAKYANGNRSI